MVAQEPKTTKNDRDPREFLSALEDDRQRADSLKILSMMEEISGAQGVMWGGSIVGFGTYTYRYASGRTGEWPRVGFSPRSGKISLYLMDGCLSYSADEESNQILSRLGKFKTGKSCLYIKRLADVDESVLRELLARAFSRTAIGETSQK